MVGVGLYCGQTVG